LDIIVNNHSKVPIYEQITNQIKAMIENGKLKEGDILPSMRGLAKSCQISVITAQKAYEDLQRDDYIETVQGKGTYVARVEKQNAYAEIDQRKLQKCIEEINSIIQEYQLDCDVVIQKLLERAGKKGDIYE
jgi:GntR family transcriptional regulator